MKKIIFIFILCFLFLISSVKASLPLTGKIIVIDPGHGSKDMGTSYNDIEEKDLNLSISKELEQTLIKNGATVILTREQDYDLSTPNTNHRKKSDFDNRIKLINESNANLYISIHINNLTDTSYSGAQTFYYNKNNQQEINKQLAENIQAQLNTIAYPRNIKTMPNIYMYKYLKIPGVLVECGFISNQQERNKLLTKKYQQQLSEAITKGIITTLNH